MHNRFFLTLFFTLLGRHFSPYSSPLAVIPIDFQNVKINMINLRNLLVYWVSEYTGRFLKNTISIFKMNFYRNAADVGISTLLNMDRNRNTISQKAIFK